MKLNYSEILAEIHKKYLLINEGHLASYIPELSKQNPEAFAIALCTPTGETYSIGNTDELFTLQSVSKAFTYGKALMDCGENEVKNRVGVEPTGEAFNSIIELEKNTHRPFNPMINSGAIAISDLLNQKDKKKSLENMLNLFSDLANRKLSINEEVFLSEKKTAHRNRAIANLLRHFEVISDDIEDALDLYFKQCSIELNVIDLVNMAGTLANRGTQPHSHKMIFNREANRNILSLMFSCGMYDTAGTWAYSVGIPAKSGVSGALIAILPNKMAIATYSPLIDKHGHSIRGVFAIKELSKKLSLNLFE